MIKFDILSIFPEMFLSPLNASLLRKAQEKNIIKIALHDIRQWATDKHKMTDDAPYGGGCGMVMKPETGGKGTCGHTKKTQERLNRCFDDASR